MALTGLSGEWGRWLTSSSCPEGSKIHNVFHVSCLKKDLGQQITTSMELPPLDEEGQLELDPEEVLEIREWKLRSQIIRECLIRWRGLPVEDATWEGEKILQHPSLQLLEDKQSREGRDCNVPFPVMTPGGATQ
jgi:hypothetical protein